MDFDYMPTIARTIQHESFQAFAKEAYNAKEGYSIRTNPETGKREMFIAGTRNLQDWILNITNLVADDKITVEARRYMKTIAEENDVQVIYGHSRGGALLADMDLPPSIQRIGLDAAMVIASNKNLLNINESGLPFGEIDAFLAQTGNKNVTLDFSPNVPHKVWAHKNKQENNMTDAPTVASTVVTTTSLGQLGSFIRDRPAFTYKNFKKGWALFQDYMPKINPMGGRMLLTDLVIDHLVPWEDLHYAGPPVKLFNENGKQINTTQAYQRLKAKQKVYTYKPGMNPRSVHYSDDWKHGANPWGDLLKPPNEIIWTPCFRDEDSSDGNRDTLIRQWCESRGGWMYDPKADEQKGEAASFTQDPYGWISNQITGGGPSPTELIRDLISGTTRGTWKDCGDWRFSQKCVMPKARPPTLHTQPGEPTPSASGSVEVGRPEAESTEVQQWSSGWVDVNKPAESADVQQWAEISGGGNVQDQFNDRYNEISGGGNVQDQFNDRYDEISGGGNVQDQFNQRESQNNTGQSGGGGVPDSFINHPLRPKDPAPDPIDPNFINLPGLPDPADGLPEDLPDPADPEPADPPADPEDPVTDCYQRCRKRESDNNNACKQMNDEHVNKMARLGCDSAQCSFQPNITQCFNN